MLTNGYLRSWPLSGAAILMVLSLGCTSQRAARSYDEARDYVLAQKNLRFLDPTELAPKLVPLCSGAGLQLAVRMTESGNHTEAWVAIFLLCCIHDAVQPLTDEARCVRKQIQELQLRRRLEELEKTASEVSDQKAIGVLLEQMSHSPIWQEPGA